MASFYYKSKGDDLTASFQMTLDNCTIDLDSITDGENTYKAVVTNADQSELDDFETKITAASGVTIINETDYNNLY
jgi:hypothetical protein|tara:strand:+ start:4884 stop:5111 length:228 start_codon:yes stop_codon:yes gene_type:complete